jgi:hypothetical protein
LGYVLPQDEGGNWAGGSYTFSIDSDTPFSLFGFTWNLNFDHDFSYVVGKPLFYKNTTGISMNLPWKTTTFTFGFDQNFIVNEENGEVYRAEFGEYAPFYMTSGLYAAWGVPILPVGGFGNLTYTPRLSGTIYYGKDGLDALRRGLDLSFSHSLGFGRVNWLGNFRNGLEASVSNSNSYNTYRNDWTVNYTISGAAHKKITDFFGMSGRLSFSQYFFTNNFLDGRYPAHTNAGGALRGVIDDDLVLESGGYMLALNTNFPLRVFQFLPSITCGVPSWRYFNFEVHLSPFIDIAFLNGKKALSWNAGRYTGKNVSFASGPVVAAGLEVVVFPLAWKSLYLRLSAGYNINQIIEDGDVPKWHELFIGVGHQF